MGGGYGRKTPHFHRAAGRFRHRTFLGRWHPARHAVGDNTVTLWNAVTGVEVRIFSGHSEVVQCACLSAAGDRLATGSLDNTAILWDTATGDRMRSFAGHSSSVKSVSLTSDGTRLATGSHDGSAILWDAESGERLWTFSGHSSSIYSVVLSSDGTRLVTGSADGTTRIWDTATGREIVLWSPSITGRIGWFLRRKATSMVHSRPPNSSVIDGRARMI